MIQSFFPRRRRTILAFALMFTLSLVIGALSALTRPATAAPCVEAPAAAPAKQVPGYAGSESCRKCHENIVTAWENTRHAQAFSSPIFQRDWSKEGSNITCLACHTTGFDKTTGKYAQEGVTCEGCHGPFQPNHPEQPMPITPNVALCGSCHTSTANEWRASPHSKANIQCQACHNPHSQTPKADSISALCTNCHKEMGTSFTHGTHANAGLECSNCHMYTKPRTESPIQGLVATGHTFTVGSDACIGCHQDTIHTRDAIVKLSGEVAALKQTNPEDLNIKVLEQEKTITDLKASNSVRLYTGLAQGAIVGLITGAAAAWVVSRRLKIVEVDTNE